MEGLQSKRVGVGLGVPRAQRQSSASIRLVAIGSTRHTDVPLECYRSRTGESPAMIPTIKKVLRIGMMVVIAYGIIYRFPC
jgi:hypothetical protein